MRMLSSLFLATVSLVLLLQLRGIDAALITPDTPFGILGFELAFTGERAAAMLARWASMGVTETVRVSLGVDVAFLLAYPAMFWHGVKLLVRPDGSAFSRAGTWLGRAVVACTPLDALENFALWRMVETGATNALALLAGSAASIKFLLVIFTAAWCGAALIRLLVVRFTHGK